MCLSVSPKSSLRRSPWFCLFWACLILFWKKFWLLGRQIRSWSEFLKINFYLFQKIINRRLCQVDDPLTLSSSTVHRGARVKHEAKDRHDSLNLKRSEFFKNYDSSVLGTRRGGEIVLDNFRKVEKIETTDIRRRPKRMKCFQYRVSHVYKQNWRRRRDIAANRNWTVLVRSF